MGLRRALPRAWGPTPEELIAAAHAGCFTMAFSAQLTEAGFKADTIETKAVLTLDLHGAAPTITKVHLTMSAKIPDIDQTKFDELARLRRLAVLFRGC